MNPKDITFPAIGIALFVALSMCLRVPVFDYYYLCLGYLVMTVYIWCFNLRSREIIPRLRYKSLTVTTANP